MTFSRGDKVYFQEYPDATTYLVGTFLRYDARGNVVVQEANESSMFSKALAVDKRIGLPVEVTFPAENCG